MKLFVFAIIIINPIISYSQSLTSIEKNKRNRYIQERQEEYNKYVTDKDVKFGAYLNKQWQAFKVFKNITPDSTPKPKTIPIHIPQVDPILEIPLQLVPTFIEPISIPDIPDKPIEIVETKVQKAFYFYGSTIKIRMNESIELPSFTLNGNGSISEFWNQMGERDCSVLLNNMLFYKQKLQLNDYAFYMLLDKCISLFSRGDDNIKNLAIWYLLNKADYIARVGINSNDKVVLLLPIITTIYSRMYIQDKGYNFYFIGTDDDSTVSTYDQDFNSQGNVFDMHFNKSISLGNSDKFSRKLSLNYKGKDYVWTIIGRKGYIDFYDDYPHTDVSVYFNNKMPSELYSSLVLQLRESITEFSLSEKAEFLLEFTQRVFEYKTDGEQFNREKYFFSMETIFYPYSDCEDRAILYSHLVRSIIGIDIIGIDYPGHVATAIENSSETNFTGSYFKYQEKQYYVADPTYIGSTIGMSMPRFKNVKAEIIDIR